MRNMEVVVGEGKNDSAKAEGVDLLVPTKENGRENIYIELKLIVKKYLKELEERDEKHTNKRVSYSQQGFEIEKRKFRKPEAGFHNSLLHMIYENNLIIDNVKNKVKKILVELKNDESIELQKQAEEILSGVESSLEAIDALMENGKNNWIATNDNFDAEYMIDILAGFKNNERNIEVLNLVQVKSSEENININEINETHQKYLQNLPKFIGILNKKEASKTSKDNNEVLDLNRFVNEDQLIFFGLAMSDFLNINQNNDKLDANSFYEYFRNQEGYMNPFVFMGILSNSEKMEEYKRNYLTSKVNYSKESLKNLVNTAKDIKFTEEESMAFYMENHTNTILDSGELYSVIMVGDKEISRVKLIHPFELLSKKLIHYKIRN